jgi:hypothetical protein
MTKVEANRHPLSSEPVGYPTRSGDRPLAPDVDYGELVPADRLKPRKTGGRAKGVPNKVSRDIRKAIRDLAEDNADRVQGWLDSVAEGDPAQAIRLYLGLLRYCVPTLSAMAVANVRPQMLMRLVMPDPVLPKPNPEDDELLK